jgi:hypothetical protein
MFILSATGNGGTTAIAGLNAAAWIAWGAQLEQSSVGPTTETPYLSSYIVNNTSGSITKPSDSLSYVFTSNASATVGTAYAEVRSLWPTATGFYPIVGFAAATQHPLFNNGAADTAISIGDGTNIVSKAGLSSTNTAVRKRASSWTGSTLAVAGDGVAAATGSFDGNMGSSGIGIGTPPTPSNIVWNGSIRNVKIFTVAATAAELASMTT